MSCGKRVERATTKGAACTHASPPGVKRTNLSPSGGHRHNRLRATINPVRMRSVFALLLGLSVAPIAVACSCVPSPIPHACPALPDMGRRDEAVFIGTVVESLPKSWKHLFELAERVSGKKFSFKIDEDHGDRELTPQQQREWIEGMKRVTIFMWRDILTPAQRNR